MGKQLTVTVAGQQPIVLDATMKEDPTYEAKVTDHPVERGSVVSDHVTVAPFGITVEGYVSDYPILLEGRTAEEEESLSDAAAKGASDSKDNPFRARPAEVFGMLQDALVNKRLVSLQTPRGNYDSLILIRLSAPTDPKDGAALKVSMTFRELQTAATQTIAMKAPPSAPGASKDKGEKSAKEADAASGGRPKSAAAAMVDAGGEAAKKVVK